VAFDLEAFTAWLGTRDVPEEHLSAYRQGAERIANKAADGPILREHVEQVIEEEREDGASERTLANLRRVGLDILRFEQERLQGGPRTKEAETYRSSPETARPRSEPTRFTAPILRALKIGSVVAAVTLAVLFGYRRYRGNPRLTDSPNQKLGTLTMLNGEKCRVAGARFRYEYSYSPGAPPGFVVIAPRANTERAYDETLHAPGIESLARSSIRQIRFFGADLQPRDAKRVSYSEVEIVTDAGSYSFPETGGKLLVGDGSRVWPSKPDAPRTVSVTIELQTADGHCPASIDLTSAEQSLHAAAVRLELQ